MSHSLVHPGDLLPLGDLFTIFIIFFGMTVANLWRFELVLPFPWFLCFWSNFPRTSFYLFWSFCWSNLLLRLALWLLRFSWDISWCFTWTFLFDFSDRPVTVSSLLMVVSVSSSFAPAPDFFILGLYFFYFWKNDTVGVFLSFYSFCCFLAKCTFFYMKKFVDLFYSFLLSIFGVRTFYGC